MIILVLSCDKDVDTFELFHHCMEKYWKGHPKIFYATESIINPYYNTICINYPLQQWTKRIRETLEKIKDEQILIMMDDLFIHSKVDKKRLKYASENLKGNIAMFNMEKSFDKNDEITEIKGFLKRKHNSPYELSIMCGLWQKNKLIKVLENDSDPWSVEYKQDTKGFDYYINGGDYIIDWGYITWQPIGIIKGKWTRSMIDFAKKEGININFKERGFYV